MPALILNLTGASCRDGLLDVHVPWLTGWGFIDKLRVAFGSYHLNDHGLFYGALRQNGQDRVRQWQTEHRQFRTALGLSRARRATASCRSCR